MMTSLLKSLYRAHKGYFALLVVIALIAPTVVFAQRVLFLFMLPFEFLALRTRLLLGLGGRRYVLFDKKYPAFYLTKFLVYESVRQRTWLIVFNATYRREAIKGNLRTLAYVASYRLLRSVAWVATLGVGPAAFLEVYIWAKVLLERAETPCISWADSAERYVYIVSELNG